MCTYTYLHIQNMPHFSASETKETLTHYLWSGVCAMAKLRRETHVPSSTLETTHNHHEDYRGTSPM